MRPDKQYHKPLSVPSGGQKEYWWWIKIWLSDAFADWSLASRIENVHCPLLAIHGDKDEYGSKAFPEYISSRCSGPGKMIMLENCGHVPHKEQEQVVLSYLVEFLKAIK